MNGRAFTLDAKCAVPSVVMIRGVIEDISALQIFDARTIRRMIEFVRDDSSLNRTRTRLGVLNARLLQAFQD